MSVSSGLRHLLLANVILVNSALQAQITIPTAQYGNLRTGANLSEAALKPANVNPATFGKLFSRTVDDSVYASPLYIPNVTIPAKGTHNVVYVATMSNTLYAFDADDALQSAPLWQRNFGPALYLGNGSSWETSWGILSTPVIYNNVLYFVAYIGNTFATWKLYLGAVDIATGNDVFGPPVEILFPDKNANLVSAVSFTIQRAALLVANNTLYIGFANFQTTPGDWSTQEGFVYSYALNDLSKPLVRFQTTNGQGGDVWQASRGLAADALGYVYATTGNGFYDGSHAFGNSVLKFSPTLNLVDWFTPANWATLYANDLDISASGPILVPGTSLLLAGGKQGVLYILQESHLGKLQVRASDGPIQQFHVSNGCNLFNCAQTLSMAYWPRGANSMLFVWDRRDMLRAHNFSGTRLFTSPAALGTLAPESIGGVSISANGTDPATGVLWATTTDQNPDLTIVPGVFRAFEANNIAHELWNSNMNAARDSIGNFVKFAAPVVANGKVYVVTQSNQLQVYGLLP